MTLLKPGVGIDHPLNRTPFKAIHPQPCDLKAFQNGLTRLFGVDDQSERPWLRVIWAQSQEADDWGWIAKDWDEYGDGGRGEWRARYLYSSERELVRFTDPVTGLSGMREEWTDIPPPRFILERLIPPDVACLGWNTPVNKEAYIRRELTGRYFDGDGDRYTPLKPIHGLYVPLEFDYPGRITGGIIADHDTHCCNAAKVTDSVCYGWYAEPGGEHLAILEELASAMKKEKERRPGILTEEERAKTAEQTAERREGYWERFKSRLSDITLQALLTHSGLLSVDPTRQKWGKFAFVRDGAHSKSGATPDEIKRWTKERTVNNGTSTKGDAGARD